MKRRRKGELGKRLVLFFMCTILLGTLLSPAALADTDGTEPKITQKPDQLVLQLGMRWAGVEFELRTDAGIFPVPVAVDEYGVLTMDLGGSTTYTLSCINSTAPIPDPEPRQTDSLEPGSPAPAPDVPSSSQPEVQKDPLPLPAVIFLMGLAAAGGAFAAFHIIKRRQEYDYDEWEDEEEGL